eukprot:Gb_21573 [translate_table: standard]
MCNIPMNLMEEFLPWLVSSLSMDDPKAMIKCMFKLVLEEEFLQEVVFTWMKEKRSTGGLEESFVPINKQVPPTLEESWCVKEVATTTHTSNQGSIIYECCKQMCKRSHFVSHDDVNNNVKVCIFHSVVEDKVIFPVVENIQNTGGSLRTSKVYSRLCAQSELIMETIEQHFLDEEFEVLPLAWGHCNIEEKCNLLYQSLRLMPLKLLERALPWLVAMLSEEESREILLSLKETNML